MYNLEVEENPTAMPFETWLQARCTGVRNAGVHAGGQLLALSSPPSQRACSFRSMSSFGSHFRVELEEGPVHHVSFDSGVAELMPCAAAYDNPHNGNAVGLLRVGILKDILVLNYGNVNIVLMVVSWVPPHTEHRPTLCQDEHGFWMANMAARPRDTTVPYLLPNLASQVHSSHALGEISILHFVRIKHVGP